VLLDNPCHPVTINLEGGDELVLYTDGVSEAFNPAGDIFGMERLDDSLLDSVSNAAERVRKLMAAVDRFRQGRKPSDDLCIVALTRMSS
jgi:serine phosphatase RsbU (regulator of sigma subunit)